MTTVTNTLEELKKESRMGATGVENHSREVRRIDLTDFAARKAQIADELWSAAVDVGFFQRHVGTALTIGFAREFAIRQHCFTIHRDTERQITRLRIARLRRTKRRKSRRW